VAPVESRHLEAEMESRGSDDEIFERDDVADGGLLTLDASGNLSDLERQRVDKHDGKDFGGKRKSALAMDFMPRAIHPMCELNRAHSRDAQIRILVICADTAQGVVGGLATSFHLDDKTGIED
jgi:hypothetical protein